MSSKKQGFWNSFGEVLGDLAEAAVKREREIAEAKEDLIRAQAKYESLTFKRLIITTSDNQRVVSW